MCQECRLLYVKSGDVTANTGFKVLVVERYILSVMFGVGDSARRVAMHLFKSHSSSATNSTNFFHYQA